jgi:isoquinoline 1-oxidoreductase beta subunit
MLGHDPRLVQCLQRVSALAGWNGGYDGSGQGVACHRIGPVAAGGCIAAVAIARRDESGVRVDRISAVADIGRIVNVDIARQQIEGGLVYGIGLALGASLPYARGLPVAGNLASLALPLLADCPQIEVELIASEAPAFDPGELGTAIAAPVIANALASATGMRFRRLPLVSED